MRLIKWIIFFTGLTLALTAAPGFANTLQCESAVQTANQQLTQKDLPQVRDTKALVDLLRYLNQNGVLPSRYVTRAQALKQGWSGKQEDSLWSAWTLNNKLLGGDVYTGTVSEPGAWLSADIDSVRGYPSARHLIYSPASRVRYLSTDNNSRLISVLPCE